MRVLTHRDLKEKGIPFCRQYISKLIRQGKFPAPGKLGERLNAWDEKVIDQYLKERMEAAQTR